MGVEVQLGEMTHLGCGYVIASITRPGLQGRGSLVQNLRLVLDVLFVSWDH